MRHRSMRDDGLIDIEPTVQGYSAGTDYCIKPYALTITYYYFTIQIRILRSTPYYFVKFRVQSITIVYTIFNILLVYVLVIYVADRTVSTSSTSSRAERVLYLIQTPADFHPAVIRVGVNMIIFSTASFLASASSMSKLSAIDYLFSLHVYHTLRSCYTPPTPAMRRRQSSFGLGSRASRIALELQGYEVQQRILAYLDVSCLRCWNTYSQHIPNMYPDVS